MWTRYKPTEEECRQGGKIGGKITGPVNGKLAVDSGQFAKVAPGGRAISNHVRWHVKRGVFQSRCTLCLAALPTLSIQVGNRFTN
jgi:hypothetical protein